MACSITAHHLDLTVDDWAGQSFNFCKPVAKYPDDRLALREIVKQGRSSCMTEYLEPDACNCFRSPGHPRFFLGSDSAPHLMQSKSVATPSSGCAAGVYTSPFLLPLMAHLLDSFGALSNLQAFVSSNGRRFYKRELPVGEEKPVRLRRQALQVEESLSLNDQSVAPFMAGKQLDWSIA